MRSSFAKTVTTAASTLVSVAAASLTLTSSLSFSGAFKGSQKQWLPGFVTCRRQPIKK